MRYAQIDDGNLCISVSDLHSPVAAPHMILIEDDAFPLGKRWQGGEWHDVPRMPQPLVLTYNQFIRLAMTHGGLTPEKYAEAVAMPALTVFLDLLKQAQGIRFDDPDIQMGGQAFVDAGILTSAGRDAIFANWPED